MTRFHRTYLDVYDDDMPKPMLSASVDAHVRADQFYLFTVLLYHWRNLSGKYIYMYLYKCEVKRLVGWCVMCAVCTLLFHSHIDGNFILRKMNSTKKKKENKKYACRWLTAIFLKQSIRLNCAIQHPMHTWCGGFACHRSYFKHTYLLYYKHLGQSVLQQLRI